MLSPEVLCYVLLIARFHSLRGGLFAYIHTQRHSHPDRWSLQRLGSYLINVLFRPIHQQTVLALEFFICQHDAECFWEGLQMWTAPLTFTIIYIALVFPP